MVSIRSSARCIDRRATYLAPRRQRRPASFAELTPASVSSNAIIRAGSTPSLSIARISLGGRLALLHVVGGDDRAELRRDPRSWPRPARSRPGTHGHDGHGDSRSCISNGLTHGRVTVEPSRPTPCTRDPLLNERCEERAVDTDTGPDDGLLGLPRDRCSTTPRERPAGRARAAGKSITAAARRPRASR